MGEMYHAQLIVFVQDQPSDSEGIKSTLRRWEGGIFVEGPPSQAIVELALSKRIPISCYLPERDLHPKAQVQVLARLLDASLAVPVILYTNSIIVLHTINAHILRAKLWIVKAYNIEVDGSWRVLNDNPQMWIEEWPLDGVNDTLFPPANR